MAQPTKKTKEQREPKELKRQHQKEDLGETLLRIYGSDIPGNKQLFVGLTYIKGVSWAVANAICRTLHFDKRMKLSDLTKEQIEAIEAFLQKPQLYNFMKNHPRDFDTGTSRHLISNELDMTREFDIKRMKQIKSYKGIRHAMKQPVRGQRTRSHFRTTGIIVGVKKGSGK